MFVRSRVVPVLLSVAGALLLVTCGGGSKGGSPTAPPVTTPTPAATPTPVPLPYGVTSICYRIGMGDPKSTCTGGSASYLPQIDAAIDDVVARRPDIFNLEDQRGAGGYYVNSVGAFYVELLKSLEKQNVCAIFDGEEVAIKDSQAFHDQYKVINSDQHVRRGASEYRTTCYPAGSPIAEGTPPSTANCKLPGSRSIACGYEGPRFDQVIEDAIAQLQQQHPEIFSGEYVNDVNAYNNGVAAILTAKGFCAVPGEEMGIKNTNDFSESYDILLASGKIRHSGYRVTCYPADF